MFLIDSSAWIEYLRPQGSKMVKERVREVLKKESAVSCGIVVVEIYCKRLKTRLLYRILTPE